VNTGKSPIRMHRAALAFAALLVLSTPAHTLTVEFPGPTAAVAQVQNPAGSDAIATGPWLPAGMQLRVVEGALDQTAYRIDAPGLTTLQIIAPLRDQLRADGYTVVYECESVACGGFDFRFGLNILPEPDMHVDMGDYRYLSAERVGAGPSAGTAVIGIIVSRSTNAGFVQITQVGGALPPADLTVSTKSTLPVLTPVPTIAPITPLVSPVAPADLGARLETGGTVALDDLVFASGAATLADGDYASLAGLAAYLKVNPARAITFVGHTDASGGLEGNIALSRARAQSVRTAMIAIYDVPGKQVAAEGVGYLSPRASNLTDAGRAANRRVEVMLTSTE
jgi:outer membrane protein OmpA-like peptidoglycan-associated protein